MLDHHLLAQVRRYSFGCTHQVAVDMLVSDHFNKPNLNNGFFFSRATDDALVR